MLSWLVVYMSWAVSKSRTGAPALADGDTVLSPATRYLLVDGVLVLVRGSRGTACPPKSTPEP